MTVDVVGRTYLFELDDGRVLVPGSKIEIEGVDGEFTVQSFDAEVVNCTGGKNGHFRSFRIGKIVALAGTQKGLDYRVSRLRPDPLRDALVAVGRAEVWVGDGMDEKKATNVLYARGRSLGLYVRRGTYRVDVIRENGQAVRVVGEVVRNA